MISISRKIFGIKIKNIYFPVQLEGSLLDPQIDLVGITQSLTAFAGSIPLETLQINLLQPSEAIFAAMAKSTRKQLRQGEQRYHLAAEYLDTPTDTDIKEFRRFYNRFAKHKKTATCNAFHEYTMRLLRNAGHLMVTRIVDEDGNILCYRVYILNGKMVTALYSASHYRIGKDQQQKRMLSVAHRSLKWRNIMHFKEKGFEIYDQGGLSNDEHIRKFKFEFGGEVVRVYSGYFSQSFPGKLLLCYRNFKIGRRGEN